MAASYPGTLRAFVTHVNTTEVVDASHVNDLQAEVVAIETYMGLNPHVSSASGGSSLGAWSGASRTYQSLADRVANVEAGHSADTHTQYVRFTGTETLTGQKTFTAGNTYFGDGSAATSGNLLLSSGTTGGQASLQFREGTTARWQLYRPQGDSNFYLRDMVNARSHITFAPGAGDAAANTILSSSLTVNGGASVAGTLAVTGAATLGATTLGATTLTAALTLAAGTGVVPSSSAVGDAGAGGTSTSVARADHIHGRESFGLVGTIQAVTAGGTAAAGTNPTPARSDHVHALVASTPPTTSAVGDSSALGASSQVARADHTHGREAFATSIVQGTIGASGPGTATNVARGDHFHGLTTAAPSASTVGDVQAAGAASSVSRSDHVHAREGFGTVMSTSDAGAASAGAATTTTRSDHKHSVSVGSPTAMTTFGLVPADGTSTALARADHNHGTPAAPTATSVGALPITGGTLTGALTIPSPLTVNDGTLAKATGGAWTLSASLSVTGALTASTTVTGTNGVYDGGNRVYSSVNPPPSAAPVVIMPFFVGGSIGTGLRRPEFICPVPMTLRGAWSRVFAGSGTYQVYVNGAAVSGAAANFSTTATLNDFADVLLNVGDRVQLNVNSASTDAVDLSVTVDVVTR